MKVCVLLPTLNEAESIADMIARVRKVDSSYEICVVDSGSTDGTVEIAEKAGAKLITLDVKGKGLAIKKAFSEIDSDAAVLLDSDMSYAPEEIPKLLKALENYDVVVGSRFKGNIEKGAMRTTNRLGNMGLTTIANVLYWKPVSDVCSGFWAFRKDAYKKMDIDARHFSLEANFYTECAKKKLMLCEVPISYGTRKGETKLTVFHGIDIGIYLIRKRIGL
ncbi:MAG: glycosyltransferase family 2 protein [Candidatus ainarchaeum sp.]|nr:glycosyltransferase family 2 protein [Candidatus ainarchaeum sp.]